MIDTECFQVEQSGNITIVRLEDSRYFDTDKYAQFQQDLLGFVEREQPTMLLVDLSNLVYLSTALTNTLLIAQRRVHANYGKMKLFGLNETVREALQHLRLIDTVLAVYPSETAAKNAVDSML
jgi:anti-anti-sigma factor